MEYVLDKVLPNFILMNWEIVIIFSLKNSGTKINAAINKPWIAFISRLAWAIPKRYADPIIPKNWYPWTFVAIVEIAIEYHFKFLELKKYSSDVKFLILPENAAIITTKK